MAIKGLFILGLLLITVSGQFVFQHGLHQHQPHSQPPSAQLIGSPQFPRFSKCMSEDAQSRQMEWWQREYGCASLFASISVLANSATNHPSVNAAHSAVTTQTPPTPTSPKDPDTGAKKIGPEIHPHVARTPEEGHNSFQQGSQVPRYRNHRGGGLFAGVGLASDVYAGGFGQYSRIGATLQDPFGRRHASPNDIRIIVEQPQRDALEDMTNDRRRRDAQTCAEFRVLATKVVTSGPLENICCNIVCYCDELQNITSSRDRCGGVEMPSPPPKTTQIPNAIPTIHPSPVLVIDRVLGRQMPETGAHALTGHIESNGTALENGTMSNNGSSSGNRTTDISTGESLSSGAVGKGWGSVGTVDSFHATGSASPTTPTPSESMSSLKKAHEPPAGGMAATMLASDKARRPVWTPVVVNGDNVYRPTIQRKSYQFTVPDEWADFIHGDSAPQNAQGSRQQG